MNILEIYEEKRCKINLIKNEIIPWGHMMSGILVVDDITGRIRTDSIVKSSNEKSPVKSLRIYFKPHDTGYH